MASDTSDDAPDAAAADQDAFDHEAVQVADQLEGDWAAPHGAASHAVGSSAEHHQPVHVVPFVQAAEPEVASDALEDSCTDLLSLAAHTARPPGPAPSA